MTIQKFKCLRVTDQLSLWSYLQTLSVTGFFFFFESKSYVFMFMFVVESKVLQLVILTEIFKVYLIYGQK